MLHLPHYHVGLLSLLSFHPVPGRPSVDSQESQLPRPYTKYLQLIFQYCSLFMAIQTWPVMLPLTGFLRCLVLWILEPFSRNVFYENISKFSPPHLHLHLCTHLHLHPTSASTSTTTTSISTSPPPPPQPPPVQLSRAPFFNSSWSTTPTNPMSEARASECARERL